MRVRTGRAFLDAFAHIANPTTGARMLTLPILMVASKTDQVNISNSNSIRKTPSSIFFSQGEQLA